MGLILPLTSAIFSKNKLKKFKSNYRHFVAFVKILIHTQKLLIRHVI